MGCELCWLFSISMVKPIDTPSATRPLEGLQGIVRSCLKGLEPSLLTGLFDDGDDLKVEPFGFERAPQVKSSWWQIEDRSFADVSR